MELKKRSNGGGHLMTLVIHQPIFSPSTSSDSTPRNRSRPKTLFFRPETISPTCSEPSSPKVNCAGRVTDRAAIKPSSADSKGEKKSTLVRSLTNSLRGSLLVDSAIRCCRSPRDSVSGESEEEEEEGGGNLARWFMTAELAGKERVEVEEGLVLAPLNALQLMKQRSGSIRAGGGVLKI